MVITAMIRELVVEGQSELLVKGTDVVKYTQRFQELALICGRMFLEESDEVEKYVGGHPDMIQGTQQQPPKKQNVAIAYTAGSGERKEYAGTLPLCNKCKFHHTGPCIVNWNRGNQAGGAEARGMVYALGGRETGQDIDDMEDDINALTLFP
ncbi:hypothetical protein Tco_1155333 [Tanacetum coccineum]